MKTNRTARRIWKVRIILLSLAIVALAGIEVGAGQSLASRLGQVTASPRAYSQAPNFSLADVMAAMR